LLYEGNVNKANYKINRSHSDKNRSFTWLFILSAPWPQLLWIMLGLAHNVTKRGLVQCCTIGIIPHIPLVTSLF